MQFGIVVMWGLSSVEEAEVVWQLAGPHMLQRVPEADIEVDEMHVQISHSSARPTIEDDVITVKQALCSAPLCCTCTVFCGMTWLCTGKKSMSLDHDSM